jgi:hypothetical protein
MPLYFNVTHMDNWQELVAHDENGKPMPHRPLGLTEGIIFAMLTCGIPELSEKNIPEFWARVSLYEQMGGSFVRDEHGPRPFEIEDVLRHRGLGGLNITIETRSKWMHRVVKHELDRRSDYMQAEMNQRVEV